MPKTIITAALTGVLTTRAQSPAIPYTPEEIAEEARRSVEAGAGIVHIHARQDDGRPAYNVETYARIDAAVRARCPEVIINYSTGAVGVSREARVAHIATLRPDMAALNMGSMNYAIYSSKHKTFYHDHVFANPFADILFFLEAMNVAGTRPEMECFDTGHIHNASPLIDMGMLRPPYQFSLIMGVLGGIPGTTKHLVQQVDNLPPGAHWQVIGIGAGQWPLVAAAVTLGGNVRVGLEDNLYIAPGQLAQSNGELVAKAAELVRLVGGEPASVSEAREMLDLPLH
ncbi:MAG: 3-keto-5-aminohexanoate cleavage protein [Anaerolineae bacterium]|uniref:3-keto-5-aminohexanoate cleavage protein n=1 Tax=Promineifilum sp. TaxID=2664178 RepID=UPI002411D7FB|nr:3-keto-5-aminohexanoate cleavage protein [Promineifilum sp.]MCW5845911.1 3-keto-5-aminohexanoate cleavage protein [Anaerolineae bacterium]